MSEEIKIQLSPQVVKKKLQEALEKGNEANAELISRMIVDNLLVTEMGISQLIYAFIGIEEKLPWLVGDTCMTLPKNIYSWECAKEEMIKREYNMHRGHIVGKIKDINMRRQASIKFEFPGLVDVSGKIEARSCEAHLSPSQIKLVTDLPDDFEQKREDVASIL